MKKLLIYLGVIVLLFAGLYTVNHLSATAGDSEPNAYGVPASKLDPATRKQLSDPEYQNIITPPALEKRIESKEATFAYFFSPTCPHCQRTTPVVNPIAQETGVDLKQLNLLEYPEGWDKYRITGTPTIVYFKDGKEIGRIENGVADNPQQGNTPEMFKQFFAAMKTK